MKTLANTLHTALRAILDRVMTWTGLIVCALSVLAVVALVAPVNAYAEKAGPPSKGCVVTQIGELNNGLEFYYDMTFCGKGIQDQILTCPRKSYRTMDPYAVTVGCTVEYYPEGFPAWMAASGIVPVGYTKSGVHTA